MTFTYTPRVAQLKGQITVVMGEISGPMPPGGNQFVEVTGQIQGIYALIYNPIPIASPAGLKLLKGIALDAAGQPNAGALLATDGYAWTGWQGFDPAYTGYKNQIGDRLFTDGTTNYILYTGFSTYPNGAGQTPGPTLIIASADGVEAGRWYIRLDNPALQAVWNQDETLTTFATSYCGGTCAQGHLVWLNRTQTNQPLALLLSPDCTSYYLLQFEGIDYTTIDALNNTAFSAGPRNVCPTAPPNAANPNPSGAALLNCVLPATTQPQDGMFFMTHAATLGDPAGAIVYASASYTLRAPPFPPIIGLACNPCGALEITGNTWQGRVAWNGRSG